MYTDDTEAAYFQMRIDRSLSMAEAATGNCARIVHRELAARYRTELASFRRLVPARPSPIHGVVPRREIEDRQHVMLERV